MADKVRYVTVSPRMNPSGQPHGVNTEHKGCCNSVVDSSALPSLVSPVAWPYIGYRLEKVPFCLISTVTTHTGRISSDFKEV